MIHTYNTNGYKFVDEYTVPEITDILVYIPNENHVRVYVSVPWSIKIQIQICIYTQYVHETLSHNDGSK